MDPNYEVDRLNDLVTELIDTILDHVPDGTPVRLSDTAQKTIEARIRERRDPGLDEDGPMAFENPDLERNETGGLCHFCGKHPSISDDTCWECWTKRNAKKGRWEGVTFKPEGDPPF